MLHRQDAEGEFFRLVRKQAPAGAGFAGASGGEYVITASGKMLSMARVSNIVKGLEEFNKLPEADRKPRSVRWARSIRNGRCRRAA